MLNLLSRIRKRKKILQPHFLPSKIFYTPSFLFKNNFQIPSQNPLPDSPPPPLPTSTLVVNTTNAT